LTVRQEVLEPQYRTLWQVLEVLDEVHAVVDVHIVSEHIITITEGSALLSIIVPFASPPPRTIASGEGVRVWHMSRLTGKVTKRQQ